MYKWLEREIEEIKTNKFHLVDVPDDYEDQQISAELQLVLPPSYKAFLSKFGGVRLYRQRSGFDTYSIRVYSTPQTLFLNIIGDNLIRIGFSDRFGYASFRPSSLAEGYEAPIYEWDPDDDEPSLVEGAKSFREWLIRTCDYARKQCDDPVWGMGWQNILQGPAPFSPTEQAIIEARKQFRWQVIGINEENKLRLLVKNESDRVLPYLTFDVRAKDDSLHGGAWLAVSEIEPGQERVIEEAIYEGLLDPQNVELFLRSDPQPEDRERYWEFKRRK